jgi:hypothetical protein
LFPVPSSLERLADEIDGWLELRCPDKALAMVAPLLEPGPARAQGLWLRIRGLVALGKHAEALADLVAMRPAVELLDDVRLRGSGREWVELTEAWCRKRSDDLSGAIACMRRLIDGQPRSAIGHFNLGCYLALAGEREQALSEVTVACGIDETFRAFLADEPDLDSLHQDPRFQGLQKKTV